MRFFLSLIFSIQDRNFKIKLKLIFIFADK
jgi:hypothetical protein